MASCKDCVHYDLCKYNTYQQAHYFGKDKEILIIIDNNTPCKFFKNKADVVPGVRCKDCKNYNEVGCANGFGWCEQFNYGQTDEQFCSYGERK